ncbi:fatty acid desaturas-like protein [Massarina eburnea CBS 473.64]|uniref:Delta 8-(E)-sphingolipid desaturase n=1 Tax=Massarina eburnea CBS 473.64 TaxID=1395130 RepID=A0A6A6RYT1_9PLEO|nr:fatty acid desaturas-like protein [Massarina eburnea CBS 473.64]
MAASQQRRSKVFARREIEALIASGRSIVIVDSKVLKVDAWLAYHPGGDKAIKHMIGRDATDEVQRFHSAETLKLTERYQIGRIEGRWANFVPPIQGGRVRTPEELGNMSDEDYMESYSSEQESASTASASSSAGQSPLFDPADADASLRKRSTGPRPPSASSVSSVELDEAPYTNMSVLDARTQQELDFDKAKYPSLDPQTQDNIVQKYRELQKRIEAEGLYACRYSSYGIECIRYAIALTLFLWLLRSGWYITSALPLGFLGHQLAFVVHDAAHMGITHNFTVDSTIAMFVASYLGGLSAGWWKWSHNVHHLVTNSPEHDPDIEYLPFFAITHRFFNSLFSTYHDHTMTYDAFGKFMVRIQNWTYYPIMMVARFNLYQLGWTYLILNRGPKKGPAWWFRYFEMLGQIVFWYWYGYGVVYKSIPGGWTRFFFVLLSHAITAPLHVQITLSHFAMSTTDMGITESFPQKMLRTTMDVDCPQWLDFFHGGLQFQAIHHLYPRIPRHNLRRTQKLVQEFCNEVDIPYALYGFVDGNKQVIGKLADVGRQAAILAECQRTIVQGEFKH